MCQLYTHGLGYTCVKFPLNLCSRSAEDFYRFKDKSNMAAKPCDQSSSCVWQLSCQGSYHFLEARLCR